MRHRTPLTYANVVSTIALLARDEAGGVAFAASQIDTQEHRGRRGDDPEDRARGGHRQAARRRGGPRKRQMQFPVYFKQSPSGGSAPGARTAPIPTRSAREAGRRSPARSTSSSARPMRRWPTTVPETGPARSTSTFASTASRSAAATFTHRFDLAGRPPHRKPRRPTRHRSGQRRAERVDDADRLQRRLHPELDDRLDPLEGPRLRLIRRWTPGKRAALAARGTLPCRSHLPTAATVRPAAIIVPRAGSSAGSSSGLIIRRSLVRVQAGPFREPQRASRTGWAGQVQRRPGGSAPISWSQGSGVRRPRPKTTPQEAESDGVPVA